MADSHHFVSNFIMDIEVAVKTIEDKFINVFGAQRDPNTV